MHERIHVDKLGRTTKTRSMEWGLGAKGKLANE